LLLGDFLKGAKEKFYGKHICRKVDKVNFDGNDGSISSGMTNHVGMEPEIADETICTVQFH